MEEAKTSGLNVVTKVEVVEKGDQIPIEVEGGWVRREAATSGYLAETQGGNSVFIPFHAMLGVLSNDDAEEDDEVEDSEGSDQAEGTEGSDLRGGSDVETSQPGG